MIKMFDRYNFDNQIIIEIDLDNVFGLIKFVGICLVWQCQKIYVIIIKMYVGLLKFIFIYLLLWGFLVIIDNIKQLF